ncbi:hypothetical protein BG011_003230 [Mortierella polycephala]|uniref:BZIP domain-containing protein n=1 Tax=Mortierella polycephala TaxID=41804 RepID=A0A9P6U463_9FUNG|nr:hypothetical protein BG011_003230 [Mortierella polycephala]
MTTVGSLSGDLAPAGNETSATSAEGENSEKPIVAPIDGGSPMLYLQACSKLDMEPNPFEQSFAGTSSGKPGNATGNGEGAVETPKPVLPSIEAMSGRLAPGADTFGWDEQSLRMGPLSPSMLQGPQNPIVFNEKTTQNAPLPVGSFPTTTTSMPTIFSSAAAPLTENALPLVGVPGPLPVPPIAVYNPPQPQQQQQQQQHQQHQQQPPYYGGNVQHGHGSRPSQQFAQPNIPSPINGRFIPPQAPQRPDMNGYGNLHLLSQAQATHREMWIKRESDDAGANLSHSMSHSAQSHPNAHNGPPPPAPPQSGQTLPGMPGMVAAPQLPKNGVEPAFVRGVRRSRAPSEVLSDDSSRSMLSGNGAETSTGPAKKKQNTSGDDKMGEEEKRKNFLERNRQAALKCRQRKKQWLQNLQEKVEYLTVDNENLQRQTSMLRDEIIHLKALLLAHKDCPVAQANGVYSDTINVPGHGGMMSHGRPAHPMQQQHGRGGPGHPRGQHPPPPHHPGSVQGGGGPRMGNQPMVTMQNITPNASPSQGQAHVRY